LPTEAEYAGLRSAQQYATVEVLRPSVVDLDLDVCGITILITLDA
jgi:hypothetical protein